MSQLFSHFWRLAHSVHTCCQVFNVRCGAKGIWEAPYDEDWPSCELLPQHHCSVAQDLNNTIRQGFKLQAEAVTQVQTCNI